MAQPLSVHADTHEGLVHDKNEDAHIVVDTPEGGVLLLVCDGMGGMGHGEIASAMAVEHITRLVCEGRGFPPERLRKAVREADTIVRDTLCNDGRGLPGSTAVMVYVIDGMGHVAWVGDSRAYLVRDGQTVERTRDHKLVNDLIAAGQLTEEEAKHSALAHVVTRALGGRPASERPVKASSLGHPWKFQHGDLVVLCSDGVCDLIDDQELAEAVSGVEPKEGVRNLVRLALERGGHDNITAVIARWDGEDYVEDDKATPSFGLREAVPELDLRDPVPVEHLDDEDGRGVTEEIEPGWSPSDEEDTGITERSAVQGQGESSRPGRRRSPPTFPPMDAIQEPASPDEDAGVNALLVLAGLFGAAAVIGLIWAVLGAG